MNRIGYMHVVKDSHTFTLYGLQIYLENLQAKLNIEGFLEEGKEIEYMLVGLKNMENQGFKLVKNDKK